MSAEQDYDWLRLSFRNSEKGRPAALPWWSINCPFHDEKENSCGFNVRTGTVTCRACGVQLSARDACEKLNIAWQGPEEWQPKPRDRNATPDNVWDYSNEHGEAVFRVKRFDPETPEGRKRFEQWTRIDGQWVSSKKMRPPIYNLPAVLAAPRDETLWIGEGEKVCDTLAHLGLLGTTTAGGANAFAAADISALRKLRGRVCVIVPDNDAPGEAYAREWAAALRDAGAVVLTIRLPGLAAREDLHDWIWTHGRRKEELLALLDEQLAQGRDAIQLAGILEDALSAVAKGQSDAREVLLRRVMSIGAAKENRPVRASKCIAIFAESIRSGRTMDRIGFGIPNLDDALDGLERGEMISIGAAPGFGKTSLLGQMCLHTALQGWDVLLVSQEMTLGQIGARLCAMYFGVAPRRLTAEQCDELERLYKDLPLEVYEGNVDLDSLKALCREWRWRVPKPRLFGVDYLQLIDYQKMTEVDFTNLATRQIKLLAKELDCTAALLGQGSKAARMAEQPDMGFFRGSSGIESNSDRVVILWDEPGCCDDPAELYKHCRAWLVKNRFGFASFVRLIFQGPLTKFIEAKQLTTLPSRANFAGQHSQVVMQDVDF